MKLLFPHFHRGKPAWIFFSLEIFFLWTLLVGLVTVNIIAAQKSRPAYWNELMKLFSSPLSVSRHIDLASILWHQGQKPEARHLMNSAQSRSQALQTRAQGNTVNVLGSATSPMDTLSQWEHEEDQARKRYAFWQTVVIAKPEYRDAFIALTALAYQLGKRDESKRWIAQAQSLDPNSSIVQSFAKLLE